MHKRATLALPPRRVRVYLKQQLQDKLIEHKEYIKQNGEDLPDIRNWKWSQPGANQTT